MPESHLTTCAVSEHFPALGTVIAARVFEVLSQQTKDKIIIIKESK
jgi:hypothetical protein